MTTGSLLLAISLLIIVALFIARPFLLPRARPPRLTEREMLLAQKEALLAQIQALDFDVETGKLPPEIHAFEREQLMQMAMATLQQLDESESSNVEADIEAAVQRLRPTQPPATTHVCPQCGTAVAAEDRFCAHCGQPLLAGVGE